MLLQWATYRLKDVLEIVSYNNCNTNISTIMTKYIRINIFEQEENKKYRAERSRLIEERNGVFSKLKIIIAKEDKLKKVIAQAKETLTENKKSQYCTIEGLQVLAWFVLYYNVILYDTGILMYNVFLYLELEELRNLKPKLEKIWLMQKLKAGEVRSKRLEEKRRKRFEQYRQRQEMRKYER